MTRTKLTGLLAAVVLAWCVIVPAFAAEAQPKPYVVLVGVGEYADKQIKPRPHAEADAKALYDLFTHKDYLAADVKQVRLLLGSPDRQRKSEPATHENIVKALNWAVTNAKRDDVVIFAFIGQGAALRDRTCFF